jgi:apolipoprotein N-acyltransferase
VRAAGWIGDVGRVAGAGACLAASGRPEAPWWLAVLGGALLWPVLARAPARRGALWAALALLPVPATGYAGLRVFDPVAWWAVTGVVAGGYGLIGASAAALGGWARPSAPLAWRPLPWMMAWFGLDLLLTHARAGPLPFPVTPGYALVAAPYAALAAIAGPAGPGLAWGVLGCAAGGLMPRGGGLGRGGAVPWAWAAGLLTATALGLQAWVDAVVLGEPRSVGLVQLPGAVERPAEDASAPDPADADRLAAYTAVAATLSADLHVWPEAALRGALLAGPEPLARAARRLDAPVVAGAFRRAEDGSWRNAVAFGDGRGAAFVADKRWLVPVYEAWLTAGVGERWPLRAVGWRIGVLVCWESLFYDAAADRVRAGADLVAVLAHDGWAAGTATPWWHARAARLVAYAVGRPVVFAAHDGPSMVWGHDGRLLAVADAGPRRLAVELAAPLAWRTPYVAIGGGGLAAAWLMALAATALLARRSAPRAAPPAAPPRAGPVRGAAPRAPTPRRTPG